jgi:hypothetical protein
MESLDHFMISEINVIAIISKSDIIIDIHKCWIAQRIILKVCGIGSPKKLRITLKLFVIKLLIMKIINFSNIGLFKTDQGGRMDYPVSFIQMVNHYFKY